MTAPQDNKSSKDNKPSVEARWSKPSLARLMPEIGQRYWKLYYAAKAKNWVLAEFQMKEISELMEIGGESRPKYTARLQAFVHENMGPMAEAIKGQDWDAFDAAFHQGVKDANKYHLESDRGYIVWKLPDSPPPDLDMTPQGS